MKGQFYQVKNINSQYARRWAIKYQRRVFRVPHVQRESTGLVNLTWSQGIGFKEGHEYGYSLGVF